MPVNNRLAADIPELRAWRRHLHAHPELLYAVDETAAFVADKLRGFGVDRIETGIGRTGIVAEIHGGSNRDGRAIALRADMDALPIEEATGLAHASRTPGLMHACGHDGHMAMLLGAARALCRTRNFDGTVVLVFQPAEEGGAGAKAMIDDGLFQRFRVDAVYGLHNLPGLPLGRFAIRPGPIMAATDEFTVTVTGSGGHAAMPHRCVDPILAGSAIVQALQQIASRNADPLQSMVVSVTQFHAGFAHNVIPDTALLSGTVRTLTDEMRDLGEKRIGEIAAGIAVAHGATASIFYDRNYPVTVNDEEQAAFCADIAEGVVGAASVDRRAPPLMGGEDFSYMLRERPGAFIFMGNGSSPPLHNPNYEFDDEALVYGASYWLALAERALGRASLSD